MKLARLAGFLYLIVIVTSLFSLLYVPSQLIVSGDAFSTFNNIKANESLLRYGIASWLFGQIAFLLLPFVLYKLLKHINRDMAALMVVFVVVGVTLSLSSVMHRLDALTLLGNSTYLQAFSPEQLQAKLMLALKAYSNGMLITQMFWGLWLFPFGYLVFKSKILPRILGILLMAGCFGYLLLVFGDVMNMAIPDFVTMPAAFGEIGIALWLLFIGVRESKIIEDLK